MTTKQEIIEFINTDKAEGGVAVKIDIDVGINTAIFTNHQECHRLIQMIEDLKPEIKAKGLVWEDNGAGSTPKICHYYVFSYSNKDCFTIRHKFDYWQKEEILNKIFDTLEEAKNYVQQIWDEHVLSLVEVDTEDRAETMRKQQIAKDALLGMAGIVEEEIIDEN